MKRIILSFVFCSLAFMGTAQKFDVEKLQKSAHGLLVTAHGMDSVLYKRYNVKFYNRCMTTAEIREKLQNELYDRVVTPQMKKIVRKKAPRLDGIKGGLHVDASFEIATGKIVNVTFVIYDDFLQYFTEKYLRELYNSLMKLTIDTTGIEYLPTHTGPISCVDLWDFLKPALEEK